MVQDEAGCMSAAFGLTSDKLVACPLQVLGHFIIPASAASALWKPLPHSPFSILHSPVTSPQSPASISIPQDPNLQQDAANS